MDTNLTQTIESKKLAFATHVKVDQPVDKEIELPYFYRSNYGNRCMVTEDKKRISVLFVSKFIYSISITEDLSKYEFEEIAAGKPISAEEFFAALTSANESISKQLQKIIL